MKKKIYKETITILVSFGVFVHLTVTQQMKFSCQENKNLLFSFASSTR